MPPATSTAFSFGGASVSANPTGPAGGMIGASTTNPSAVGSTSIFGGGSSAVFGSASTAASSVTAPASNLFGSAPSAVPSVPSIPSVPSFGVTAPATSAAQFTFATAQGSSIASTNSNTVAPAPVFGGSSSGPFGSTSTASSSVAAPASNLFGSAPSAVPSVPSFGAMAPATSAAPFTFGATAQGSNFMGSQNQPPNAGIMGAPAGGMFSLGTVDKRTNLKAKKK